jgi:hypothetical protein
MGECEMAPPTLKWCVCPVCGLAGSAPEGFSYCRRHGEHPIVEEAPSAPLTAIEIVLGRRILNPPPSLNDWLRQNHCLGLGLVLGRDGGMALGASFPHSIKVKGTSQRPSRERVTSERLI